MRTNRVTALHPPAAGLAQVQFKVLSGAQRQPEERPGPDGDPAHTWSQLDGADHLARVDGRAANQGGRHLGKSLIGYPGTRPAEGRYRALRSLSTSSQ